MERGSRSRKPRLSDKAEQDILQRIHSGELVVGAKLPPEPKLAEAMNISRGILREALNSLQAKGYISRTPRGGSYVCRGTDNSIGDAITARVRQADLQDLLEFREALETKAIQLAVERATDAEIAALRAIPEQPPNGFREGIDYYFHYRLAELSRNRLFVVFLDMYYDTIHQFALESYRDEKRKNVMMREHTRIVEALEKRDKRACTAAVKRHLRNILRRASGDCNEQD